MKKLLSLLMALAMVVSMVGFAAAEEEITMFDLIFMLVAIAGMIALIVLTRGRIFLFFGFGGFGRGGRGGGGGSHNFGGGGSFGGGGAGRRF